MSEKLPDRLVLVTWLDAWADADNPVTLHSAKMSHQPETIRTLGWVLVDDAEGIQVANEFYQDSYRGRTFIPRAMVKSVREFRLTGRRKVKR